MALHKLSCVPVAYSVFQYSEYSWDIIRLSLSHRFHDFLDFIVHGAHGFLNLGDWNYCDDFWGAGGKTLSPKYSHGCPISWPVVILPPEPTLGK